MATTKDRLDELTRHEREPDDHDVVALEDGRVADAEVPPAAAGNRPAVAVLRRSSLRGRLLEPLSGRWAAIGAVAWVVLLGIGIAVEPQPTNPNAADPWFLNVLGTVLLAAVVAAFAGFWLATAVESGGLAAGIRPARGLHRGVPSVRPPHPARRVVGRPARLRPRAAHDQCPWPAAGLNRARGSDQLPVRRVVKAVRAVLGGTFETSR